MSPGDIITRVVLTFNEPGDYGDDLKFAAALADLLNAELQGLFIEDINLLNLAALPFAREFSVHNAAEKALDVSIMERHIRAQADKARAAIDRAATRSRIRWSFQVVRGSAYSQLPATAEQNDLVVLRLTRAVHRDGLRPTDVELIEAARSRANVLLVPEGGAVVDSILAPFDGSPQSVGALKVSGALMRQNPSALTVLIVAETEDEAIRLREQARDVLRPQRIPPRFMSVAQLTVSAVTSIVTIDALSMVVLDARATVVDAAHIAELLQRVRCPILLVG